MTFGLIIGNRGFFPDHLAKSGREEMLRALNQAGIDVLVLGADEGKHGSVETYEEAKRCAALFRKNADRIDGVIVSLPNFGDEQSEMPLTPCRSSRSIRPTRAKRSAAELPDAGLIPAIAAAGRNRGCRASPGAVPA